MKKYFLVAAFTFVFLMMGCLENIEEVPLELPAQEIGIPSGLKAEVSDGSITVSWKPVEEASKYKVYRSSEERTDWTGIAETTDTSYTDDGLINGRVYLYSVSAVSSDGLEGGRSESISAIPTIYSILINDGDEVTGSLDVRIDIAAPSSTELMSFSNDSLFVNSTWERFSSSRQWRLEPPDGEKRVFARFMDISGSISQTVSTGIRLDTYSSITSVSFSPDTVPVGGTAHFTLEAAGNETQGQAWIELEGFSDRIELYDNGNNGDSSEDDGVYEADFKFPSQLRGINLTVTGNFIDRAGNMAVPAEAADKLCFTEEPVPVRLIGAIDSTTSSITIKWEQSSEENFRSYRIYRDTDPPVEEAPQNMVKELFNISQTTYPDGGLTEGMTYHYRVFVVNDLEETAGSNEIAVSTYDAYPTPVVLDSVSAVGTDRLTLTWSKNNDTDFKEYRIYRSLNPGVTESSTLIATISERELTYYDETGIDTQANIYYYRVFVYDKGGKFSRSNEVSSAD